jgi:hypothetical protein
METNRFLSVLENLGSNAFVLVRFQKFSETIKSFVLSLKTLAQFKTFWFRFAIIF